jgi:hypothetical protein
MTLVPVLHWRQWHMSNHLRYVETSVYCREKQFHMQLVYARMICVWRYGHLLARNITTLGSNGKKNKPRINTYQKALRSIDVLFLLCSFLLNPFSPPLPNSQQFIFSTSSLFLFLPPLLSLQVSLHPRYILPILTLFFYSAYRPILFSQFPF